MNHRHLQPNEIDLLVDGEVGFGVTPLRAHVRECGECRAELESARAVATELERMPHFSPSSRFSERVMAQVQVFEPAHVTALDTARRWVPQSRPARVLAGTGAVAVASLLSVLTLWLGARADSVVFVSDLLLTRMRAGLASAFGDLATGALGRPALALFESGGTAGLLAALSVLLATFVVAGFGLRFVASASRRRRS